MSHTRTLWIVLVALAPAIGGCVSQAELDRYQQLYRTSQGQVIDLRAQIEQLQQTIQALRDAPKVPDAAMVEKIEALEAERDSMLATLKTLEQQIREAASRAPQLPPEVDDALAALAEEYAEIMQYDPDAGMIRLRSDLTFASGRAVISDQAKQSLVDLAVILNEVTAAGYGVMIVGHTDNVPIRHAVGRHPTNWHLSVHRAIAVKDVLEDAGMMPSKLGVSGYGEYRPIAPNDPAKGNRANRRVEIYVVAGAAPPALQQEVEDAGPEPEPEVEDMQPEPEPEPEGEEPMK